MIHALKLPPGPPRPRVERTPRDPVALIGVVGRARAAVLLGGTADKQSVAYRTAMQSVIRYDNGTRAPRGGFAVRLDTALREEARAVVLARNAGERDRYQRDAAARERRIERQRRTLIEDGAPVAVQAHVTVSNDERDRAIRSIDEHDADAAVSGDVWREVFALVDSGDADAAGRALVEVVAEMYVPGMEVGDVFSIRIGD